MLSQIKGTVIDAYGQGLVVEVGGLGFSVTVVDTAFFPKGSSVELQSYLHWNQENGPTLYGFKTSVEKKIFLLVIGCSGIGPKIGLAVLAHFSPAAFIKVISTNDLAALSSVSGIGPKKAEQMLLQLRHKVAHLVDEGVVLEDSVDMSKWKNISDALNSLNYSKPEVLKAMHHLQDQPNSGQATFDELLRSALAFLSKGLR
jgi:Holliday junction DNA helicase RuvA